MRSVISSADLGPLGPFATIWRHRVLIGRLTRRELAGRYRGSLLGLLWTVLTPLLMLAVYTFVFSTIFQSRWTGVAEQKSGEYALFLFAGLTLFNILAESLNRSPGLMLENVGYIKKVVFPLEVMPVVILASALVNASISMVVLIAFYVPYRGLPPESALLAPMILVPFCLLTLGLCWFLSAAGVFLRDIRQFIGVLVTLLLFLSPVFYPAAAVSEKLNLVLALNPLTPLLEQWRASIFDGTAPDLVAFLKALGLGWLAAWLGHVFFAKARDGFADVV